MGDGQLDDMFLDYQCHCAVSIAYVEIAVAMWENLRKRYAVANTPKIHQLKTDIAECKQEGLDVVEFYSELMGMWSELTNYTQLSQCTGRKYECNIGGKVLKMLEEQAHQFLMGLNGEVYANIRSQILATDLLLSLHQIFNVV